MIGDIYICPKVARQNAAERDTGVREELSRLVIHGVLHVLGYDHPDDAARVVADVAAAGAAAVRLLRSTRRTPQEPRHDRAHGVAPRAAATLVAAVLATADSALLAFHASEASATSDAAFAERERSHRALSMGARRRATSSRERRSRRRCRSPTMAGGERTLFAALARDRRRTLAEGVGRAIGYSNPADDAVASLPGDEDGARRCSARRSRSARAIDRALHAIIPPPPDDDADARDVTPSSSPKSSPPRPKSRRPRKR